MIMASMVGTKKVWVAFPCAAMPMNPGGVEVRHDPLVDAPHQRGQEEGAARVRDRGGVEEAVARREVGYKVHEKGREFRGLAQRGERDRLGRAGGPAGEAQAIGRLHVAVHAAVAGRTLVDELAERIGAVDLGRAEALGVLDIVVDEAAGAAVAELVAMVRCRLAHVERDPHEARLGERVIGDQAIDPVGQQHAHAVARLEAFRQQRVAEPVRRRVECAEAQRARALGQRRRLAEHGARAPDVLTDLHEFRPPGRVGARRVPSRAGAPRAPQRRATPRDPGSCAPAPAPDGTSRPRAPCRGCT